MLDEFSVQPPAGFPDHPHRGQGKFAITCFWPRQSAVPILHLMVIALLEASHIEFETLLFVSCLLRKLISIATLLQLGQPLATLPFGQPSKIQPLQQLV